VGLVIQSPGASSIQAFTREEIPIGGERKAAGRLNRRPIMLLRNLGTRYTVDEPVREEMARLAENWQSQGQTRQAIKAEELVRKRRIRMMIVLAHDGMNQ
jgi:hypothetical protein